MYACPGIEKPVDSTRISFLISMDIELYAYISPVGQILHYIFPHNLGYGMDVTPSNCIKKWYTGTDKLKLLRNISGTFSLD